jgi:1,4-alpha-glucan branching enzyme
LIGVPEGGAYLKLLDTDDVLFGGSSYSRVRRYDSEPRPSHGFPHRLKLGLPPLASIWLAPER